MPRKHQYVYPELPYPLPHLFPGWVGHTCKWCGRQSGLDVEQMRDMPLAMARCPDSPVRIGIPEWIWGRVDCLEEDGLPCPPAQLTSSPVAYDRRD